MGKPLTREQNERVRTYVRALLKQHDDNQSIVAPLLGMRQPTLSGFLIGRQGTSYPMVERLAELLHKSEREILGKPPEVALPKGAEESRALAGQLAKQHGVHASALHSVMAEEITAEQQRWSVLQWTDHIRWRERELFDRERPAPARESGVHDATPGTEPQLKPREPPEPGGKPGRRSRRS